MSIRTIYETADKNEYYGSLIDLANKQFSNFTFTLQFDRQFFFLIFFFNIEDMEDHLNSLS